MKDRRGSRAPKPVQLPANWFRNPECCARDSGSGPLDSDSVGFATHTYDSSLCCHKHHCPLSKSKCPFYEVFGGLSFDRCVLAKLPVLFHPDTQFFIVLRSVTSLGQISKVRRVLLCSAVKIRNIFTEGNRFYEYPSLSDGVSWFLWAVKACEGLNFSTPPRSTSNTPQSSIQSV